MTTAAGEAGRSRGTPVAGAGQRLPGHAETTLSVPSRTREGNHCDRLGGGVNKRAAVGQKRQVDGCGAMRGRWVCCQSCMHIASVPSQAPLAAQPATRRGACAAHLPGPAPHPPRCRRPSAPPPSAAPGLSRARRARRSRKRLAMGGRDGREIGGDQPCGGKVPFSAAQRHALPARTPPAPAHAIAHVRPPRPSPAAPSRLTTATPTSTQLPHPGRTPGPSRD